MVPGLSFLHSKQPIVADGLTKDSVIVVRTANKIQTDVSGETHNLIHRIHPLRTAKYQSSRIFTLI